MEINDELLDGTMEEVENSSDKDISATIEDSEEVNLVEDNVHRVMESLNKDNKPKGENIYVENDISGLERMLGISSKNFNSCKEDNEVDTIEEDNEEDVIEEDFSSENKLNEYDVISSDHPVISIDDEDDKKKDTISTIVYKQPETIHNILSTLSEDKEEENKEEENKEMENDKEEDVLLSDFMDLDTESFTFLERCDDGYSLCSLSLEDKREIKNAVRSPNYIFRYPRLTLHDSVLGYKEQKTEVCVLYHVYFPNYTLSFSVPLDYVKPYSQTFKDYFEDLVSRIRPEHLTIKRYSDSVTISSLKVVETGLLELTTDNGKEKYLIDNPNISFYAVLYYIRGLSDQGSEHIELKMIPAYFRKI